MTALAVQRITHSLVSVRKVSVGGWLIWTAMKMAPAAAAQTPAARVRLRGGDGHGWLLGPGPGGVPGDVRTLGTGVVSPHHHVM